LFFINNHQAWPSSIEKKFMNLVDYDDRYCLFLDILGFKNHVDDTINPKKGTNRPMTFPRLKGALNRISEGVHYREHVVEDEKVRPSSRQVTQFSDSVVVSYLRDKSDCGVSSILMDVHRLQIDLVSRGILLRGAVTSGLLYHDKNFIFGPALNEAVELEKLANYPRVILDVEILDEGGLRRSPPPDYSRSISSMASEDFDGMYYVDYFNVHLDDFNDDWDDLREYLEGLRYLIKSMANIRNQSIKVKHSWLRTKFNMMAVPFQKTGFKKIGIHNVPEDIAHLFSGIKPF
jgi:hypothetical protein